MARKDPSPSEDERFQNLKDSARLLFNTSDSAHDIGHATRVLKLAELIGLSEGADLTIIRPAAYLHDIGCAPKHLGKECESEERTLMITRALLAKAHYNKKELEEILAIIGVHGFSKGVVPKTLEGKVLQDADRLDAMGAIGIARTFLVGGAVNRPMYHLQDPWAQSRPVDDKSYNLDHFFKKLMKLKAGMHTRTAKKLAEERHRFLDHFLRQLREELGP